MRQILVIMSLYLLLGYLVGAALSPSLSLNPLATSWADIRTYYWLAGGPLYLLLSSSIILLVLLVIGYSVWQLRRLWSAYHYHLG